MFFNRFTVLLFPRRAIDIAVNYPQNANMGEIDLPLSSL
jgi:hypothetical protein